jgi:NADH-quinone oxidoreductase subunit I
LKIPICRDFDRAWVTLKNMFRKPVTLEYPERSRRPRQLSRVPNLVAESRAGPSASAASLRVRLSARAIRITPAEIPADDPNAHIEKIPQKFEINMFAVNLLRALRGGLPESAIKLKNVYSLMEPAARVGVGQRADARTRRSGSGPDSEVGQE